jgi:hypothetical protein
MPSVVRFEKTFAGRGIKKVGATVGNNVGKNVGSNVGGVGTCVGKYVGKLIFVGETVGT